MGGQVICAFVVETEPMDSYAVVLETERALFRFARLRTRRDRADFDKAEAEPRPCVEALAVLVEPGGQTDAIGEAQTKQFDRVVDRRVRKRQRRQLRRAAETCQRQFMRSEEHTSELQSLMRISYAVFCLKKHKHKTQ